MSTDDKSSVSESSTIFRKEDTFIVTEKDNNDTCSSEDLRRRKAFALAKANARHAVKMESSRNYFHRQSKTPTFFTNQNSGHSRQRNKRVYIEGTGTELKNRHGEQIYFQWKETDGFSRQQTSRVLPSVRKLYEYKKHRLKSKTESWKSAPHKKSISIKVLSQREAILKRSKTSLTTANDLEASSVLSTSDRLNMRVAFADNDNTALENTDANSECHLPTPEDHRQGNTRYPLSVIPETSKNTLRKDTGHNLQPIEDSSSNVVSSSDSITPTNVSQNLDVSTRLSFVASVVQLAIDVKDSSKVPCQSTHKILSEAKFNNSINDIQHWTDTSQHVQRVPGSNSCLQTHARTNATEEIQSEIEHKSKTISFTSESGSYFDDTLPKTCRGDCQPMGNNQTCLPESCVNTHDPATRHLVEQALIRHTKTEPVYRGKNVSVSDNKITEHVSGRDNKITGHLNDRDNRDDKITRHLNDKDNGDNKITGHLNDRDNRDDKITGHLNNRDNGDNKLSGHLNDRENTLTGCVNDRNTLGPMNDRSLGGQERARNDNAPTHIPTTGDNMNTINKKEHAPRVSDDFDGREQEDADNGIAEIDVIAKSNINTGRENVKSTEKIRALESSINEIDVIKSKSCISEQTCSYSNEVIKNVEVCRSSNDQNIKLSVSRGLKFLKTSVNSKQENLIKKVHPTSAVCVSEKVNRSEKHVSVDLKGAKVNPTSQGNSSVEDHGSKISVHKHIRTRAKLPGGDQTRVINPNQTHKNVIVSSNSIDHRFVNKPSRKGTGLGTLQFERTFAEQGSHSRVTELNRGAAVAASHAFKTSPRDAEVSMATSQGNTNITTGGQRRKPGLGMKDSLFLLPASVNNLDLCNTETCHSQLQHNDLSQTLSNGEKKHLDSQVVYVSNTLQGENSSNTFPTTNAGDPVVTDKHCHNMNHGCRSITDGSSNDMLNLDLFDINEGDETKSTSLSINRLKNTSNLAPGELHLNGGVQNKGNAVSNDVSSRKSKTRRSPKNKVKNTDSGSRQETKENLQYISKRNGNRLQINVAVSANNMSTVQKMRGHCDSCEEASIVDHQSISGGKIIYDDFHAVAISAAVVSARRTQAGGGNDHITAAIITCGDKNRSNEYARDLIVSKRLGNSVYGVTSDNIRQPTDNARSVVDDFRNTVLGNSQLNGQTGTVKSLIDYTKPISTKTPDDVDDKDEGSLHNSTITRKGKVKKRQTLSLHTQKMEFRELPKKNVNKTSLPQQMQLKATIAPDNKGPKPRSFMTSQKSAALQDIQDVKDLKGPVSNSEMFLEVASRPKTAGLSAYATSHHQPDDLWSVNTGDDNYDDDEDDQIQFIDGEQDFYKVFGYNEETAAILSATKVYPVQDCVVAVVTSVEQSVYSSKRTKELYVGSRDNTTLANHYVSNTVVNETSSENNKTLINRNFHKEDAHVQRNETLLQRSDQSKASKNNSNSLVHTDKSFTKNASDDCKPTATSNQGYVNIYRKLSKNHLDSTAVHVTEGDPGVNNQSIVMSVISKDGRQIERSSPSEQKSDIFVPTRSNNKGPMFKTHEQELTELTKLDTITGPHKMPTMSTADAVFSKSTPSVETSTNAIHSLGDTHKKGRRRIHSDADIPTNNNIPAPISDWHSERNMTFQNEHFLSPRETNIQGHKDFKSHVALRNQLATEKHINHTRYHRHVNNGANSLYKNSSSPTKDYSDGRHGSKKDTIKPPHFKSKENTSHLDQTSQNPYLSAADRILSRISDTENLIHTRSEVYNSSVPQGTFHNRVTGTQELSSPLRRMSHPVDTRIKTTQPGSYVATRPRKLRPILQLPEEKPDHK